MHNQTCQPRYLKKWRKVTSYSCTMIHSDTASQWQSEKWTMCSNSANRSSISIEQDPIKILQIRQPPHQPINSGNRRYQSRRDLFYLQRNSGVDHSLPKSEYESPKRSQPNKMISWYTPDKLFPTEASRLYEPSQTLWRICQLHQSAFQFLIAIFANRVQYFNEKTNNYMK